MVSDNLEVNVHAVTDSSGGETHDDWSYLRDMCTVATASTGEGACGVSPPEVNVQALSASREETCSDSSYLRKMCDSSKASSGEKCGDWSGLK